MANIDLGSRVVCYTLSLTVHLPVPTQWSLSLLGEVRCCEEWYCSAILRSTPLTPAKTGFAVWYCIAIQPQPVSVLLAIIQWHMLQAQQSEEEDEAEQASEEEDEEQEQAEERKQYHLRERRPIQQTSLYQPSFGNRDSK